MESDEIDEVEELDPAEALARAKAARERVARRVAVPWTWDAYMATSLGVVLWLLVDFPKMAPLIVFPWIIAKMWMTRTRQRRIGVVADGMTNRTSDPLRWWMGGVGIAVIIGGVALASRWEPAMLVVAVVVATVFYVGSRWLNHRLISRIRNAP